MSTLIVYDRYVAYAGKTWRVLEVEPACVHLLNVEDATDGVCVEVTDPVTLELLKSLQPPP